MELIFLVPIVLIVLASIVTIRQGMIGVNTIFGKYQRVLRPGLSFRIPFIEMVLEMDKWIGRP